MLELFPVDVIHPASGSRQSFREAGGQSLIVFDPTRLQQASAALFDPRSYGRDATLVHGAGGRGAAWFVHGPFGAAVLRHYRRGGWMARFNTDHYLFAGQDRVRSLAEFSLLQRLRQCQLPVPNALAACYSRQGLFYRAAILVECIEGSQSFAAHVTANGQDAAWETVGRQLARFHVHNVHHADLNANNILLDAEGGVHLIDWDKGRIEVSRGAWCHRVIRRLRRSLDKECNRVPVKVLDQGMARLSRAHDEELAA